MKKYHSKQQLPIDKGWDKMQILLDSKMPQNPVKNRRKALFAASLILVLLGGWSFGYWTANWKNKHHITSQQDFINRKTEIQKTGIKRSTNKLPLILKTLPQPHFERPVAENQRAGASIPVNKKRKVAAKKTLLGAPLAQVLPIENGVPFHNSKFPQSPTSKNHPDKFIYKTETEPDITRIPVIPAVLPSQQIKYANLKMLPLAHADTRSMQRVIHGIRRPLRHVIVNPVIRHKNELALSLGSRWSRSKSGLFGVQFLHRLSNRWSLTTGVDFAYSRIKEACNSSNLKDHAYDSDFSKPDNNSVTPGSRNSKVKYAVTTTAKTSAVTEDFKVGLNYNWTPKTELSVQGVMSFLQSKTDYQEDFTAIENIDLKDTEPPQNPDFSPLSNFSVLYPEYSRQDVGLMTGVELGIRHKTYRNVSLFLRGRWFFSRFLKQEAKSGVESFVPRQQSKFSGFTTHIPELRAASVGLIYSFGL